MKVILSIATSDSGGGAGIQADIKTSEYFGVFCTTAVVALTSQNTLGVNSIFSLPLDFVHSQLDAIMSDFKVDAIKIGMLGTKEMANAVKEIIKDFKKPIILDPVAISRAGSKLLEEDAKNALMELFPYATLITPNHFEADYFGLNTNKNAKLPKSNFLIKNINPNSNYATDRLFLNGKFEKDFKTKFAQKENTHGTGCSYSAAITANLALGFSLLDSIKNSKKYIYNAIKYAPNLGFGNGPICHSLKVKKH